jgi:ketosteroid isomerase-like protein
MSLSFLTRSPRQFAATAAAVLVLTPLLTTAQSPRTGAAAEVEAREIAFATSMADRDLDAFLSFVASEAVFFSGNQPLRGRDAVRAGWAPLFEGPTPPFSWRPDVVEVLASGALAFSSGPVTGADGEVVGRFNSIWRKDPDGVWRVVFDKGS